MRLLIVLGFVLAACAPSMEMQRLSEMCEAGDAQACVAHEQLRQQRVKMLSDGLYQSGSALNPPQPAYQPRQPMTCVEQGVFVNCY